MKLDLPDRMVTDRLTLQPLRYEDAEEIFYVYASKEEATRYVSWPIHRSIDDTRSFLRAAVTGRASGSDYSYGIRITQSSRFIGSFGFVNESARIQFGYVLGPLHWGQGYATEVCQKMMDAIRQTRGSKRVGTFIDAENTSSGRVLIKSGLVEESRASAGYQFVNQNNKLKDCIYFRLP